MSDESKRVYLMRGLPGCGKSHTARRLAGATGVVLETDQYFYTQVGGDDPGRYDFSDALLPQARAWNYARFTAAIAQKISPIVVDRGNGLNPETRVYVTTSIEQGYTVELAEPDSPWWRELRILLKYKQHVSDELFDAWAMKLAESTRDGHRVPRATIRHWMARWKFDLRIEEILASERP